MRGGQEEGERRGDAGGGGGGGGVRAGEDNSGMWYCPASRQTSPAQGKMCSLSGASVSHSTVLKNKVLSRPNQTN